MHEFSIVQSLVRQIQEIEKQYAPEKIKVVYLEVGELSGVEATSVDFYYKELVKSSSLENTELVIHRCGLKGQCQDCGLKFDMKELVLTCPDCLSQKVNLIGGRELLISAIDLKSDDQLNKEGFEKA